MKFSKRIKLALLKWLFKKEVVVLTSKHQISDLDRCLWNGHGNEIAGQIYKELAYSLIDMASIQGLIVYEREKKFDDSTDVLRAHIIVLK